ncbi:unnamed protein product, partial [Scytosiphon promiscuus]
LRCKGRRRHGSPRTMSSSPSSSGRKKKRARRSGSGGGHASSSAGKGGGGVGEPGVLPSASTPNPRRSVPADGASEQAAGSRGKRRRPSTQGFPHSFPRLDR